jgi:methylmalonyl-CoA carboxyltransferase large subunit
MSKAALEKIAAAVEQLQAQVAILTERLGRLEGPAAAHPEEEAAAPVAASAVDEISPEILLAISAAVAAYLGERAHIRAVRLVSTTRWSQEGRVSIQASHRLSRG